MTGAGEHEAGTLVPDDSALVGFKHHLSPVVVPGEATYLVSRRGVTALHGTPAEVLAPLLDGSRTLRGVLSEAERRLPTEEAVTSLDTLARSGLLGFRPAGAPAGPPGCCDPAAEAYWDLAGLDGCQVSAELAGAAVCLEALPGIDPEPVRRACRESGVAVAAPGSARGLTLVLCDDYLTPELAEVDARHRASGTPWLLTKVCGTDPWIGPVFRPDSGPCWNCLAQRLRGHRRSEWPVQRALGLTGPPKRPTASLAAGRAIAVHFAVLEAVKWLAGMRYPTQGMVHTLDTMLLSASSHPVHRRPQCPVCGDPELVARTVCAPFVPVSRPKTAHQGNSHRCASPQEMLDRYRHLVGPVTGIVKGIHRAPRTPDFVDSYLSGHNLAFNPHSLAGLRAGLRALSGGKGLDPTEAQVSALGEAVERYSGTRHGDEPVVRDSLRGLGEAAVHPNDCQLYDSRQFRDREAWNARGSHFQYVPRPFDEGGPTEWTPLWSLTGNRQRLLPTSMLYFSHGTPADDGLHADSNGNAAGSSAEDALVQGFLELVERDAVALWWYNRTRQPAVDLDAFPAPEVDRFREGCLRLGRELWVLDLTSDFGIPVLAALSRRTGAPTEDVIFGFGAHFDPRVALRRALTELGQILPAVLPRRPGATGYGIDDPEACRWWRTATTTNQPHLLPDRASTPRTPWSWAVTHHGDLLDDVTAIVELVRSRGLELLVLDQTRPDLELPVVKVVVPGLRHFWARLAPGRLYDVPVALGRLERPTPYELLNPIPLFI
ncbi:TOMM precursor leader peptide-binding protein [Streptomyces yaanensis]|uniref:TOMM leader peptide-binding protein n=1 Tax=Streptomyces yaanensis TaxID=1142239 RepID=A0ABV7SE05_9ACTN|nr:TOMM precursor leader peptide-binding protein [Streptomyces sp. CGMCC 4.7035]WNB99356.1 TOMM precursor leader peptide-binding protein [Streptomyces sp. CGMCC 4.7035]